MEDWQREMLAENKYRLIELTSCNDLFLQRFQADGVLHREERKRISSIRQSDRQTQEFYDIIETRVGAFDCLVKALQEHNQTGAYELLKQCMQIHGRANIFKMCKLKISPELKLFKKHGGFTMYSGTLGSRNVTVKRVRWDSSDFVEHTTEIQKLERYDEHQNILRFFTAQVDGEFINMALELCFGVFCSWIKTNPNWNARIKVFREVTSAVQYLHDSNVIHFNIHPTNILLVQTCDGKFRAKLSDFRYALTIPPSKTITTFSYKQVKNKSWKPHEVLSCFDAEDTEDDDGTISASTQGTISRAVDIFGLGCLLYYSLTKTCNHPFGITNHRRYKIVEDDPFLDDSALIENIPMEPSKLLDLVKSMIHKTPNKRYSVNAVLAHENFDKMS